MIMENVSEGPLGRVLLLWLQKLMSDLVEIWYLASCIICLNGAAIKCLNKEQKSQAWVFDVLMSMTWSSESKTCLLQSTPFQLRWHPHTFPTFMCTSFCCEPLKLVHHNELLHVKCCHQASNWDFVSSWEFQNFDLPLSDTEWWEKSLRQEVVAFLVTYQLWDINISLERCEISCIFDMILIKRLMVSETVY